MKPLYTYIVGLPVDELTPPPVNVYPPPALPETENPTVGLSVTTQLPFCSSYMRLSFSLAEAGRGLTTLRVTVFEVTAVDI